MLVPLKDVPHNVTFEIPGEPGRWRKLPDGNAREGADGKVRVPVRSRSLNRTPDRWLEEDAQVETAE